MRNIFFPFLIVVAIVLYASVFVVQEGSRGLVLRFNKVQRDENGNARVYEPGLHFKAPFIESVKILDHRIQLMENPADRFMTREAKQVMVDSYLKWRIVDVNRFYVSTRGGNMAHAESLLRNRLNDRLRSEIGCREIKQVITDSRGELMSKVLKALNGHYADISVQCMPKPIESNESDDKSILPADNVAVTLDDVKVVAEDVDTGETTDDTTTVVPTMTEEEEREARKAAIEASSVAGLGIEVIDVRIKQINLPEEVSKDIYNRMRGERAAVAQRHRSRGLELAAVNRANADYAVVKTLAEAKSEALKIQGEGDATAAKIFAEAFNKAPEFYQFLRSMTAYENSFKNNDNIMVLDPQHNDFLYYLRKPVHTN